MRWENGYELKRRQDKLDEKEKERKTNERRERKKEEKRRMKDRKWEICGSYWNEGRNEGVEVGGKECKLREGMTDEEERGGEIGDEGTREAH